MDRVRFGRALGYGARHAAKALTQAAAAANAPSSSGKTSTAGAAKPEVGGKTRQAAPKPTVEQRAAEALDQMRMARQQAKRARGSLLTPMKRFSSVLWLQVTGTFFAVMAATTGVGAWRLRGALHKSMDSHEAMKLYLCLLVFAVFTYFTVSSFVRAERR